MSQDNPGVTENRAAPIIENVSEATVACLITMVQGNVLALSLSHLIIATQTGVVAGVITALAILFTRLCQRWVIALVLGVATATVDFFVHPGMFGPIAAEAVVTGVAAAGLSLLFGWIWDIIRAKSGAVFAIANFSIEQRAEIEQRAD